MRKSVNHTRHFQKSSFLKSRRGISEVMLRKCGKEDEERILFYIGEDYPSCLYLYLNLKKYGFDSGITELFVQQENGMITAVLLQYYSCLHVFSRDNSFDAKEVADFFSSNDFTMLYCESRTAKKVYISLPESIKAKVACSNGWVASIKHVDKAPKGIAVPADRGDFCQIAHLILSDEKIGKSYRYKELEKQLRERNSEGYSRNLVIKQSDLIIAHACTNAEIDNIAVVAELIVKEDYRRAGYASEIWRDICQRLLSEGKEVFSFYYSMESRALHHKIGFCEVCDWTKVVKCS